MTDRTDEIARNLAESWFPHEHSIRHEVEESFAAALRSYAAEIEARLARLTEERLVADKVLISTREERDRLAKEVAGLKNELMVANVCANMHRDERNRLREAHKRLAEVLNDSHDVPPEHDSEPVPFHKGWELAVRRISACLSPPTPEGGGG